MSESGKKRTRRGMDPSRFAKYAGIKLPGSKCRVTHSSALSLQHDYTYFVNFETLEQYLEPYCTCDSGLNLRKVSVRYQVSPREMEETKRDFLQKKCDTCKYSEAAAGDECEDRLRFSDAYDIYVDGNHFFTCPKCGGKFDASDQKKHMSELKVYDVRLADHVTMLKIKRAKPTCPGCGAYVPVSEIAGIQTELRSGLSIRLKRSMLDLSIKLTPDEYISQGYGVPKRTVNEYLDGMRKETEAKANESKAECVQKFSRVCAANSLMSGNCQSRSVMIEDERYTLFFADIEARLEAIFPEKDIKTIQGWISGDFSGRLGGKYPTDRLTLILYYGVSQYPYDLRGLVFQLVRMLQAFIELIDHSDEPRELEQIISSARLDEELQTLAQQGRVELDKMKSGLSLFGDLLIRHRPGINNRQPEDTASEEIYERVREALNAVEAYIDSIPYYDLANFGTNTYADPEEVAATGKEIDNFVGALEERLKETSRGKEKVLQMLQYWNPAVFDVYEKDNHLCYKVVQDGIDKQTLWLGAPAHCLNHFLAYGALNDEEVLPVPCCIERREGIVSDDCRDYECPYWDLSCFYK